MWNTGYVRALTVPQGNDLETVFMLLSSLFQ